MTDAGRGTDVAVPVHVQYVQQRRDLADELRTTRVRSSRTIKTDLLNTYAELDVSDRAVTASQGFAHLLSQADAAR